MDLGLSGKTALVTGASSVIGQAVAERLVSEGVAVVLAGAPAGFVESLRARGGEAIAVEQAFDDGVDVVAHDVLDWRGGFQLAWLGGLTEVTSLASLVRVVDVVADHLASHGGGSMVLQSASAAFWDVPTATPEYAAAAAAVTQLARRIGVQYASSDVRANAVCPGGIVDPHSGGVLDAPTVPLAPAADAADVADLAVFLLSPRAAYTTGQAIVVDGGASII